MRSEGVKEKANRSSTMLILVPVLFTCLQGCSFIQSNEEGAIKACKSYITEKLRSPSTYKRINTTVESVKNEEGNRSVFVEYDADNAFGTPIRGLEHCAFKVEDDGAFPNQRMLELIASTARSENQLRELQKKVGKKVQDDPIDRPECCVLRADNPTDAN